MSMKLIMSGASPFARMVRVTAREAGLAEAVEEVAVTSTPHETDPSLAAANPLGKLPALLRDEGPALYDSRVICRYLDARGGAGLYPETRLWEVLTLEATAHGIAEAALAMVYEARFRDAQLVSEAWVEAQWAKATRALDAVEARWTSHLGGKVTAAQIALGCTLGYLDLRHGARDWRAGRPGLAAWEAVFAERPAMAATRPET